MSLILDSSWTRDFIGRMLPATTAELHLREMALHITNLSALLLNAHPRRTSCGPNQLLPRNRILPIGVL